MRIDYGWASNALFGCWAEGSHLNSSVCIDLRTGRRKRMGQTHTLACFQMLGCSPLLFRKMIFIVKYQTVFQKTVAGVCLEMGGIAPGDYIKSLKKNLGRTT